MAFFKKFKSLLKMWFLAFFSFEISPWGQLRVLPGVKIKCIHTKSVFVWMHSILTPGALYFDPRQHSILPPSSTWFWPPEHIFKIKKTLNDIFKRNLDFWKKKKKHISYNIPTVLWWKVIFLTLESL